MKLPPSLRRSLSWFLSLPHALPRRGVAALALIGAWGLFVLPEAGAGQILTGHVPAAARQLQPVRDLEPTHRLHLSVGLPLRNPAELEQLLQEITDPASPQYRHFLTPEEFTRRFGPAAEDYQAVIAFAQTNGLRVTATHPNRMLVEVEAPVQLVEQALHLKMRVFAHPTEAREFFAPDTEPELDLAVPVLHISGLDNFVVPRPLCHPEPASARQGQATPASGSGPSGTFEGGDFRAAYVPGVTNTGAGQSVGLFEFGGYYESDILAYEASNGLPNVTLTNVLLDGVSSVTNGAGAEEALDIEMAISMAPGLNSVIFYFGESTDDILNRIASDNTAKQISASWTYGIDATSSQIWKEFAAQGISFFNASGDSDAYYGSPATPTDNPYVISVGGTTLTTSGPGGSWVSEKAWNWGGGTGTSGGVSTTYAIPAWQQGISMSTNLGSTTMRNLPDVALTADNVWVMYDNGSSGSFGGTSCAAPLWAGFTALINQQAVANGHATVGFINPAVYAIGKGSNYTVAFHDIATGSNTSPSSAVNYPAVAGYDLCTGWGTPMGSNTITALAGSGTNNFVLTAWQTGFTVVKGGGATALLGFEIIRGFTGTINLAVSGVPAGVAASLSSSSMTNSLANCMSLLAMAVSNTAAVGTYPLVVTGTSGDLTNSITISLTVIAPIPGATAVGLSTAYNHTGIYVDGKTFSVGLDGSGGSAYSANLLGPFPSWNRAVFTLGPSNTSDAISCSGQTLTLPTGQFTSLQLLAIAVDGSQASQTFTVTYTNNSTATFTQSISDWAVPQNYSGESIAVKMAYRDSAGGAKDTNTPVNVYGYSFTLNQTSSVASITLPNNSDLRVLAITLLNDPVPAPLVSACNRVGIYTDGTTFTNDAVGTDGLDGDGSAYSATFLSSPLTWNGLQFDFMPANVSNVISSAGQTVALPVGNYSVLRMLATGVNGDQTSQSFTVNYADGSTGAFTQSLSDWYSPQKYAGESNVVVMGHRNLSGGTKDDRTFYLYGYSFTLNSAKVLQSIRLPNNTNVEVVAISLIPNWAPTFTANPFTEPAVNEGKAYSGTIATNASDLNGDTLTFAKVSGPAWLSVAASGALSGTPANTNANTNVFVVSVTDPGGLSNTATMNILVHGAPYFLGSPFSEPAVNAGQAYAATIATNATDPNSGATPSFAKVSGPAWLSVGTGGALSGTPANTDANTNVFVVSVTDSGGLSNTATMHIYVNGAPYFLSNPFSEPAVTAGQAYSANIATNATDPNPGDVLTFAVVSGPGWLSMAANGALSGTPLSANVGTNAFVVSVTDPGGLSGTATMDIAVSAAAPMVLNLAPEGTNFLLSWSGGIAPYQVQMSTDLTQSGWIDLGAPVTNTSGVVIPSNTAAFYRVVGQ
jgi:hypothetical protein